jgi:hypothetical protein
MLSKDPAHRPTYPERVRSSYNPIINPHQPPLELNDDSDTLENNSFAEEDQIGGEEVITVVDPMRRSRARKNEGKLVLRRRRQTTILLHTGITGK